uniref:Uncharacterized protein n=1 Tax=Opuntia streptacantha TaxID=393608 RepID=A0A7C8YR83_OPUST
MGFPSDVRVFIRNQAYSFSTYRANDNTGILVISIRAFVLSITSMLKTEHLLTAVTSEGKEINLLAISNGAVLSQVWKCRSTHFSNDYSSLPHTTNPATATWIRSSGGGLPGWKTGSTRTAFGSNQ